MPRAYVLINCELGSEKSLISKLYDIESVKEVHGTLGMYDIVARLESDSDESINCTVTEIRKLSDINSTMTLTRSEGQELFIPNPDKPADSLLGQNLQAYVVIHCDQSKEYGILRKLSYIPQVKEADAVFGFYDVMCKIEAPSYRDLEKIITKDVRNLEHVRTTMTLNVIAEQE